MKIFAGTSGFSFKGWRGHFYPEKMKPAEYLGFYGERFPTVELNNTFYRMPKTEVLETWRDTVPDGFRFVVKASRRITHMGRLKNTDDSVQYLYDKLGALGHTLGPVFFQLPPNMKVDAARLERFLGALPDRRPIAFEFRNPGWFDESIYALLRASGVALCLADTDDDDLRLIRTADWAYVRLRREAYDDDALRDWHRRLADLGVETAWVFFKHEDEGKGPKLARRFLDLA